MKGLKDNSETLIYIHIGKCGGISLENALQNSHIIKKKFSAIHRIHINKPPILKNASYAIVVRNPIKRIISAFNWRYKLVVTNQIQKNRFDGEYEILKKYTTLNALCEQLYEDEVLNSVLSQELQTIHHIKENISFYLQPLLDKIAPSQIYAVFTTEFLNEDISKILDFNNEIYVHQNSNKTSSEKNFLSEKAYRNLKTYLEDDYLYLSKLITIKKISSAYKNVLLK